MAYYKTIRWILMATNLLSMASIIVFADEMQTPESPNANLLCISECGTCPVICSPPPSPPTTSPESGNSPPLTTTPTPPLLTPSTPLLLPPEAPIFEFSPPPSYQLHPPPPPPRTPKAPPSGGAPKTARSPPNIPYVIVPGGPAPPLGQGNNYPYPYYYFYSNGASLSNQLYGFCFSVVLLLLVHVFCFL